METIKHNNIKFYKIKDFDDYYISKCGKVLSTKRYKDGILIKEFLNKKGYPSVQIYNNVKQYRKMVHRLLAIQFIPNPLNLPIVEHIDDNPLNFSLNNLKWSTQAKNIQRAYDSGRKIGYWTGKKHCNRKKVKQLDLNRNLIKVWDCVSDASKSLNVNNTNITFCCNGKQKTAYGFKWEYL